MNWHPVVTKAGQRLKQSHNNRPNPRLLLFDPMGFGVVCCFSGFKVRQARTVKGGSFRGQAQGMCLVVGLEKAEVEKKCQGTRGFPFVEHVTGKEIGQHL